MRSGPRFPFPAESGNAGSLLVSRPNQEWGERELGIGSRWRCSKMRRAPPGAASVCLETIRAVRFELSRLEGTSAERRYGEREAAAALALPRQPATAAVPLSRARRVRAGARAGRLDRAFSPFCGTPCGACPPSGRQRVICVTMAPSYNRGCTMALWLRRSLSKRKAPTASSCFQAAGLRRLIRHGPGLIILTDYDAATLIT